jgi:hypothetical protein
MMESGVLKIIIGVVLVLIVVVPQPLAGLKL